jgi:hypothetical protein
VLAVKERWQQLVSVFILSFFLGVVDVSLQKLIAYVLR